MSRSGGQSSTEDGEPVETLVAGRTRRSTAGRNMATLLDAEADDELALLFAEDENDEEFESEAEEIAGADVEDMQLDSSSEDDEDQGPSAQDEDFEGEKELQKQAKAERLAKKRKAHESLKLAAIRKRVKIDTSTVSTPPPRPKKKSERISWLPTPEEGPTRSSSRRQTMQNKELTHARLKDSEEKRIRLIATMEEAAKRKERLKPKGMTQAERLAEAERVERINSKSLNRWEEMEKKKAEEQRAKLEALQNRRLEGPVMSWWSGLATWVNGRLTRVGKVDIQQKPEKEEKESKRKKKVEEKDKAEDKSKADDQGKPEAKEKPEEQAPADGKANPEETVTTENKSKEENTQKAQDEQQEPPTPQISEIPPDGPAAPVSTAVPESAPTSKVAVPAPDKVPDAPPEEPPKESSTETKENSATAPQRQTGFLDGIHLYASMPESSTADNASEPGSSSATEPAQVPPTADDPLKDTTAVSTAAAITGEQGNSEKDGAQKTSLEEVTDPAQSESKEQETPQETHQPPKSPNKSNANEPSSESLSKPTVISSNETPEATDKKSPQESEAVVSQENITGIQLEQQGQSTTSLPQPSAEQAPSNTENQPDQNPSIHLDAQDNVDGNVVNLQQPEAPPVIEYSGRNLIVLENFDEKTAQNRNYSIYFNTKKPPRLTSMSNYPYLPQSTDQLTLLV